MEWAAEQGAEVVNMSLGGGAERRHRPAVAGGQPATAAVRARCSSSPPATTARTSAVGTPGRADAALTVGAVDRDDELRRLLQPRPAARRRGDQAGHHRARRRHRRGPGAHGTELGDPGGRRRTTSRCPAPRWRPRTWPARRRSWPSSTRAGPAPQLKAALVASAHPNGEEPVWWQGGGRVDLAAATGSSLTTDRGTVDLGFFDWPHGGDAAVSRTVTYTNDGTAPLSLDLAAALHDDGGRTLPASALSISPATLALAAGQSGTVTVTVSPDDAGVGRWGGYLTASSGGTVLARAALGLIKETERYPLHVHVLGPDGKPLVGEAFIDVINPDTGDYAFPKGGEYGADQEFRVAPGTWSVAAAYFTDDNGTVQIIDPGVEVKGETSVTLNGRGAKPVLTTVRGVPAPAVITQVGYGWRSSGLGSGIIGDDSSQLSTKATARAPQADFEWFQAATRREAAVDAVVAGQHVGLDAVGNDERLDGRRTVTLAKAPAAGRKVSPAGAYVLLEIPDAETPLDDLVTAAKAAGAGGVLLWTAEPYLTPWLERKPVVPLLFTGTEGPKLQRLVGAGPRAAALTGRVWSRPVFDLFRKVPGRVPADVTVRARIEDLAPATNRFRSLGDGFTEGSHVRFGDEISGAWAIGIPVKLGTERTDYLSPGQWTDWLDVYRAPLDGGEERPLDDLWLGDPYTVTRGKAHRTDWLDALLRPGDSTYGSLVVAGDELTGYVTPFPDASGHFYGGYETDQAPWTLRRGSTVVATGDSPVVSYQVPAGPRRFTLTMDVAKPADAASWQRSTSAHSVWSFTAPASPVTEDPDEFAYAVVPTLGIDAKLPLDLTNSARAGSTLTFEASARLPLDADLKPRPVRVSQLSFATSTDGGKHWTPAAVQRVDGDSFTVTVRNGARPGPVAVRMSAAAPGGTTVEQVIQAAYRLR